MAGVLPGVEAARRRRCAKVDAKRSSYCLYATNNQEFHFTSHYSSLEKDPIRREVCDDDGDEMLDAAVREAKQRLDLRFQQTSSKSELRRKVQEREAEEKLKLKLKSQGKNLYRLILKRGYQSS